MLDEPLTGLDVAMRDRMVVELKEWTERWKIPVLSVTHALGEAFLLEAEVVKIADGQVVQQGPVGEVLAEESLQLLKQLGVSGNNVACYQQLAELNRLLFELNAEQLVHFGSGSCRAERRMSAAVAFPRLISARV